MPGNTVGAYVRMYAPSQALPEVMCVHTYVHTNICTHVQYVCTKSTNGSAISLVFFYKLVRVARHHAWLAFLAWCTVRESLGIFSILPLPLPPPSPLSPSPSSPSPSSPSPSSPSPPPPPPPLPALQVDSHGRHNIHHFCAAPPVPQLPAKLQALSVKTHTAIVEPSTTDTIKVPTRTYVGTVHVHTYLYIAVDAVCIFYL